MHGYLHGIGKAVRLTLLPPFPFFNAGITIKYGERKQDVSSAAWRVALLPFGQPWVIGYNRFVEEKEGT